jgi:hypothetical protein
MYVPCAEHHRVRDDRFSESVPDNSINEDLQEDNKNEEENQIQIESEGYPVSILYRNQQRDQQHIILYTYFCCEIVIAHSEVQLETQRVAGIGTSM